MDNAETGMHFCGSRTAAATRMALHIVANFAENIAAAELALRWGAAVGVSAAATVRKTSLLASCELCTETGTIDSNSVIRHWQLMYAHGMRSWLVYAQN